MKIMTQAINTEAMTIKYICKELLKMRDEDVTDVKVNLSLDLTRPEYIMAKKSCAENEEQTFICTYYKDEEVLYTGNAQPKTIITDVKKMLDSVSYKLQKAAFEDKCYEAYKLDWMMSHGYSLDDLYKVMLKYEKEMFDPTDFRDEDGDLSYEHEFASEDLERSAMQARDILLFERGFGNGGIWVSKGEFLGAEYKDASYMKKFLSNMPQPKKAWEDYCRYEVMSPVCNEPCAEVPTSAGVIRAYVSPDPGQPGIVTMFQPAGYDAEIDTAFVSVYEDKDYMTADKERPVDLCIMSYGDPYTEDYTRKDIIRRENIQDALSGEESANTPA